MKRFFCAALFFAAVVSNSFSLDTIHVIEKGDTLYSLSKKYGVSVGELCTYNNLADASKIKLGQSIKIPSADTGSSNNNEKSATNAAADAYTEYLVQSGDTLFGIARTFDTTVAEIRALNNMSASATLKSGQRLRIRTKAAEKTAVVSVKEYAENTSTAAATPIEDPRQLQTRATDANTVWPVKASQMSYVAGKTNSVLLNGGKGEKVTAIRSGSVIFSGVFRGSGMVVFVQPKSTDYVYVYSGFDNVAVKKGDTVEYGAVLGTLGVNAVSQKPELNFMVFKNGSAIDPATAPRG